jgi:hypothetical protein
MEVSGQLHVPSALPSRKEPQAPTGWEGGWAPEPVWTLEKRKILQCRESNPGCSACSPLPFVTPTELTRLPPLNLTITIKMIITNDNEITDSLIGLCPADFNPCLQYSAHLYLGQKHKPLVDVLQYSASPCVSLDAICAILQY